MESVDTRYVKFGPDIGQLQKGGSDPPAGMIMVELDGGSRMPMTAVETATIAKAYLEKQGVAFRSA